MVNALDTFYFHISFGALLFHFLKVRSGESVPRRRENYISDSESWSKTANILT